MDCINLRKRFGSLYRVSYEESYSAERGEGARADDPWLQIIRCQHGHIFPNGGDILAASTNKRGSVAKQLADLDCATVLQDGDDGINAAFHVETLDKVAKLFKPRRRRQLSEREKERLRNMGRDSLERHRQHNVHAPERRLETHARHRVDSADA